MGGLQETVVTRGNFLPLAGIFQEVAGELFARELVEGKVLIEGANDVVSVGRDVVILIAVIAHGVGVADKVEPIHRHAFAEVRRGEEFIDDFFKALLSADEGVDFFRCGRQSGEVEIETSNQGDGIGVGRGLETFGAEFMKDESVDPVFRPVCLVDFGDGIFDGRSVGPGCRVFCAFGNPAGEKFDFLGLE